MKIGVLSETHQGERRVALVPDVAARLAASGFEVVVEAGAGEQAGFTDEAYREARRGGRVRPGGPAEHSRRGAFGPAAAPRGRGPAAGRRDHDQLPPAGHPGRRRRGARRTRRHRVLAGSAAPDQPEPRAWMRCPRRSRWPATRRC